MESSNRIAASKENINDVVIKARSGCQDSLELLCEHYQEDLSRYIFRLTLNRDLTDDIKQETMLQMCKSIKDLKDPSRMRAWLFRTAWGKAMDYYRSNKKHAFMTLDETNLVSALEKSQLEGLKTLISKEIAETLIDSVSKLDIRQRSVLMLRCYEDLSYAKIASVMDCSEIYARVQFYRAKNSLRKRLSRKGVTAPMFLVLLGLFGQVTSPTQAAIKVPAATVQVGGLATAIGWGLSKTGVWVIMLTAGAAVATAGIFMNLSSHNSFGASVDKEPKSFHFTKHAWKDAYIPTANLRVGRSLSKGAYEQWFFFPEGLEGPLFKMMQRWDPKVEVKLCSWLLNEKGQHYYHSGSNVIYLMNNPLARRNTARFPSDSKEFCAFLDSIEGEEEGVEYIRDPQTGLLKEIVDHRFMNAKDFVSGVTWNSLNETTFGNFRYKWPEDAGVVDERDAIHQQQWTQFDINGQVNGTEISGKCRIPFVYDARDKFPPLLMLKIGDDHAIVDSPDGAYVVNSSNKAIRSYPAGTFFKGLVRPWFGLHTIDLLRREAAKFRIPFEVENVEYDGYSFQKRILTLHQASGFDKLAVTFTVDINKDEIEQIKFNGNNGKDMGTLSLSYLSNPEEITEILELPDVKRSWFLKQGEPVDILWLFKLAQGSLIRG